TGSLADPVPGALGQPHTEVQHLGGLGLGNPKAGGRFTLGTWVGWDQPVGAETSYFFLGERSSRFLIGSGGLPVLARPFFDANPQSNLFNRETASLVAGPGVASGSVAFAQSSQVWGIEANMLGSIFYGDNVRLTMLLGYRYLDLKEDLTIDQTTVLGSGAGPLAGFRTSSLDSFGTQNQFSGGQVGLTAECGSDPVGRWLS